MSILSEAPLRLLFIAARISDDEAPPLKRFSFSSITSLNERGVRGVAAHMLRDNASTESCSWKEGSVGAFVLEIDEDCSGCSDGGAVVVTDILGAFLWLDVPNCRPIGLFPSRRQLL